MSEEAVAEPNDRGEVTVQLDGTAAVLRPSYEAIVAFEGVLGRGLMEIAQDALTGRLKLSETAQVVCECVRAWGRDSGDKGWAGASAQRIGRLIVDSEGGLHGVLQAVSAMLALAVTGGYDAGGNVKALATKTTVDAPPASA